MNYVKNNNYYNLPETIEQSIRTTKNKKSNVTVVDEIDVAIKIWDDHIKKLEAKLSFLVRMYDDYNSDFLYQQDKKVATLKREINDAMEQRQTLMRRANWHFR